MWKIFLVPVIILAAGSLMIVGTDWCLTRMKHLRRYRIGRWSSEQVWREAVKKCARKWLVHTPIVQKTDNCQYVLVDVLKGNYRNRTIQSWQTAMLALGLSARKDGESKTLTENWARSAVAENGAWKKPVGKVDFAMQAFALMSAVSDAESVRPAMEEVLSLLEDNLCADGMISYSQGTKTPVRYVDTLGMVCPFLTAYGLRYGQLEYVNMAIVQLQKFREFGLLTGTALPCHAYETEKDVPLGIYGWGRGTAWYFLGLLDTWIQLPSGADEELLRQWVIEAAEEYWKYQKPDGGFDTILTGGGQYDSSATAAMAYFYRVCGQRFSDERYLSVSDRCLEKLKSVTMRDGAIDCCQGDTHGIGRFSAVFDVMPFAQGLAVRTLALKERETHV